MGSWYWLGVAAGVGAALGVLAVAVLGAATWRSLLAAVVAGAAGFGLGLLLGGWAEAAFGGGAGVLGSLAAGPTLRGTLARGGTRGGTSVLLALFAVAIAALAFVPILGYLLVLAVPVAALRARRRSPERYAGLRTLARD